MTDPFRIEGPAQIAFSGGRTSGYLLWRVLQAHGGTLPPDIHVVFTNTGKEREETLAFIGECQAHWNVLIRVVERDPESGQPREATLATASREGEPFAALIAEKQFLPHARCRFCTIELKIRPAKRFMQSLGYEHWDVALGVRADEPARYANLKDADARERFTNIFPLWSAGVVKCEVSGFWAKQPFDLQLRPDEGNCDLCFLKGQAKRLRLMMEAPARAGWWGQQERETGGTFRKPGMPTYEQLYQLAMIQRGRPVEVCAPPRCQWADARKAAGAQPAVVPRGRARVG